MDISEIRQKIDANREKLAIISRPKKRRKN